MWEGRSEDDLRREHEEKMNSFLSLFSSLRTSEQTIENNVRKLEKIRKDGNCWFAMGHWDRALESYSNCITLSFGVRQVDDNNELFGRFNRNLMLAYSNRAATWLRLRDYENALIDADNALHIAPKNVKTLVRKGRAAHGLALFEKACEAFRFASEESPEDQSILKRLMESSIAYEQSETGKYDFTDYFSKGCTGEIPSCADFVGPVEIRRAHDVPGGRGLFATKSLEPGELLLVSNPQAVVREKLRTPFMHGDDPDVRQKERVLNELTKELARRIIKSKREMARLYSLASDGEHEMRIPSMDLFRPGTEWVASGEAKPELDTDNLDFIFEEIVCKKRFEYVERECPLRTNDVAQVTGLWILPAFANHSCAPNCQLSFLRNTIFFRASRQIPKGEELTVPYLHYPFEDVASRRKTWKFSCKCEHCLFEEKLRPQLSKNRKAHTEVLDAAQFESVRRMGQKRKRAVGNDDRALEDCQQSGSNDSVPSCYAII